MKHLAFATIIDYAQSDPSATADDHVVSHLAFCAECQQELERARQLLSFAREPALVKPSSELLNSTFAAFRRKMVRQKERLTQTANLEFDSWSNFATLGARGSHQEHQLLFSTPYVDVDIEVRPPADEHGLFALYGQILSNETAPSPSMEGIEYHLSSSTFEPRLGLTDHLGRFHISLLDRGTYSLRLIDRERDILIDSLSL